MKDTKRLIIVLICIILILCMNKMVYAEGNISNETIAYFSSEITKGYGTGDCILLENYDSYGNKRYGMIDTGRYIEKNDKAGNKSSVVKEFLKDHNVDKLDFLIITHSHSDHNGGAIEVLDNFKVNKIYMKEFDQKWSLDGTQKQYEFIIQKAIEKQIKVIGVSYISLFSDEISPSRSEEFKKSVVNAKEELFEGFNDQNTFIQFGSSKMKIYNWEMFDENGNQFVTGQTQNRTREIDENDNNNSLGVLLEQGNKKAFFAGDITNLDEDNSKGRIGDEDRIKDQIGKVDLLKLAHHGYEFSNTENFMNTLKPEFAVITNDVGNAYTKNIEWLKNNNVNYLYTISDEYGITATIKENEIYLGFETAGIKNLDGTMYYIQEPYNDYRKVGFKYKPITQNDIKIKGTVNKWTNVDQQIQIAVNNSYRKLKINGQEMNTTDGKVTMNVTETNNYNIEVESLEGGTITKNIEVEIDKNAPTIEGIKNGKTYLQNHIFRIADDNSGLASITIAKDGTAINTEQTNIQLSQVGDYSVKAVDNAGNATVRAFSISDSVEDVDDYEFEDDYDYEEDDDLDENEITRPVFSTEESEVSKVKTMDIPESQSEQKVVLPHTGAQKIIWGVLIIITIVGILFNIKSNKINKQIKKGTYKK